MATKKTSAPTDIDDLSLEELAALEVAAQPHLDALAALLPGLVTLAEKERQNHPGRGVLVLLKPLGALFEVLAPARPEPDAARREAQKKLVGQFDTALGDADYGDDPEKFEVDVLA